MANYQNDPRYPQGYSAYAYNPGCTPPCPPYNQWLAPNQNSLTVANAIRCDPCQNDPLYNPPPPPPCAPCSEPCRRSKRCKCKSCRGKHRRDYGGGCAGGGCGGGPGYGGDCGPGPCGPPKDPCPLKSFCDPGLANTCAARPLIDPLAPRRAVTTWKVNYLVSNRINNNAAHYDIDLINPWGIAIYNNQLWVVNNTSDTVTNYDLYGNKQLGTISLRDAAHNSSFPTGIAINCGGGFSVTSGSVTKSAQFITASEHGTVHAFNPTVDPLNSYIVINQQLTGSVFVYKGLAIANNLLYLPDFFQGKVDVFDSSYNRLHGFHFIDGDTSDPIPLDYGPNNMVHIGCFMYILYTRKDPNVTVHDLDGPGHGFVSVFNLDGSFVRRFTSRGVLNSPWAMIPAPCECGFPPGSFLIGNNGDGRINVFDCNGRYVGPLLSQAGLPIVIEGLWGLAPHYTDFNEIFFASSANENRDGLVGSIVKDQVIYF